MKYVWGQKKNKYGACRQVYDGINFASKLEMNYYKKLQILQKEGFVHFFLFQVPFRLAGNTKYVVDFVVFYLGGTIEFVDTKGRDTAMSILKRKQVEATYPIQIQVVKKV